MTPPRSATNHALSLRLTDEQWKHLALQARLHGVTLSEAARRALERDIEAQPDLGHGDGSPGSSMAYRTMLALTLPEVESRIRELVDQEQDAPS